MKKFVVFVVLLGFTLGSCEKDENTPILIPSTQEMMEAQRFTPQTPPIQRF